MWENLRFYRTSDPRENIVLTLKTVLWRLTRGLAGLERPEQERRFVMHSKKTTLDRRAFLKKGVALGVGTLLAPAFSKRGWTASKERVVIFQGVSLDSLHPYAYSGGGIVGIWLHMIEPLVQMDF